MSAISRSKSCDSIDKMHNGKSEKEKTEHPQKGKSKLKEHRRRGQRAVTLHNLDTEQLLLILDLRMRYFEETRLLKSQGNLNQSDAQAPQKDFRRAMTPQPYRKSQASTMPRLVRSHTPQPGQKYSGGDQIFPNLGDYQGTDTFMSPPRRLDSLPTGKKESPNRQLPPYQDEGASQNEVNVVPRPKSRPSVQQYFLPPEPIHRSKSAVPFKEPLHRESSRQCALPSQPITRQVNQIHHLPPEPLHRDGSAFQVVGHPNIKQLGPMYHRGTVSHDAVNRTPGEVYCEQAIRDNFKLYANPYILKRDGDGELIRPPQHISTARSLMSEPPPPYAPPPTYQHVVRKSDVSNDESSTYSQDDGNVYEVYDFDQTADQRNGIVQKMTPCQGTTRTDEQGMAELISQLSCRRKESQGSSIPESEDDVFSSESLRSRLSRTPQSINSDSSLLSHSDSPKLGDNMQQPFIPIYKDGDRRRKPKKRSDLNKIKMGKAAIHKTTQPDILQHDHNSLSQSGNKESLFEKVIYPKEAGIPNGDVDHVYAVSAKHRRGDGQSMSESSEVERKSVPSSPNPLPPPNGLYEDITDVQYARNDTSSYSVSSQASLISGNDVVQADYTRAIDNLHPGLMDPRVLETMI